MAVPRVRFPLWLAAACALLATIVVDHALLLRGGTVIASGRALSLVNSGNLSALYRQSIGVVEVDCGEARPVRVCVARGGAPFD